MSGYEEAKTRVKIDHEWSEELEVNMKMHQGPVMSPFHPKFVLNIFAELVSELL